jgi:hypothetical protein
VCVLFIYLFNMYVCIFILYLGLWILWIVHLKVCFYSMPLKKLLLYEKFCPPPFFFFLLAYQCKDIVFRFIIEYSTLRDF